MLGRISESFSFYFSSNKFNSLVKIFSGWNSWEKSSPFSRIYEKNVEKLHRIQSYYSSFDRVGLFSRSNYQIKCFAKVISGIFVTICK